MPGRGLSCVVATRYDSNVTTHCAVRSLVLKLLEWRRETQRGGPRAGHSSVNFAPGFNLDPLGAVVYSHATVRGGSPLTIFRTLQERCYET
jgi:hypothetical protein